MPKNIMPKTNSDHTIPFYDYKRPLTFDTDIKVHVYSCLFGVPLSRPTNQAYSNSFFSLFD
jgi:hypothetical protein